MADGTENLWFYWPMLGTGVIVAITSVVLVGVGGLLGADWGHGKIDRRATASVGFDRGTVARLEVAALLHDLGRATVSNAVWDKLDPDEAGEELRRAARVRHLDADAVSAVLEDAGQRPATVNRDLLPAG